jgi:hypothetical protein
MLVPMTPLRSHYLARNVPRTPRRDTSLSSIQNSRRSYSLLPPFTKSASSVTHSAARRPEYWPHITSQQCLGPWQHPRPPHWPSSMADRRDVLVFTGPCRCPINGTDGQQSRSQKSFSSIRGDLAPTLAILVMLRGGVPSEDRCSHPA